MTLLSDVDDADAAKVLREIRRLVGKGERLRTSGLLERLAGRLQITALDAAQSLRELHRAGLVSYQPDARGLPVSGFVSVAPDLQAPLPHQLDWAAAVEGAAIPQEAASALSDLAPKLSDLCSSDMQRLARALSGLSAELATVDDAGFNVSARRLLGSSKVLAQLSPRMLQALGLPARLHTYSPKYVVCAGPSQPEAVLFIENPRAFENAVRSGLSDSVATVCTFGFSLTYLGAELSAPVTGEDRPIQLVRAGSPPALGELLASRKAFFWGDLDRAALDIFRCLRGAMPQLQLSGIYRAMIPSLSHPEHSHPYCTLVQKEGQLNVARSRPEDQTLAALWDACAERAVDQEQTLERDIARLGGLPL